MSSTHTHILSLETLLSDFFEVITHHDNEQQISSPFLQVMTDLYHHKESAAILSFLLDDSSTASIISQLKDKLRDPLLSRISSLNAPLTYLLDELICNIQQHAQTDKGYAYINYNTDTDTILLLLADFGVTIYGSYVAAQKHLDKLGNSDAEALNLAQKGYSVKNLPNAENRGYGISSNIKMVVDGLSGEFAMLSGNALMLQSATQKKILELPDDIDFKGTMIAVTIPASVPDNFNLYRYTS